MSDMPFYKNTRTNSLKILQALKDAQVNGKDFLTVGEIARATGLHKWTVSRTVDLWMGPFVSVTVPQELEDIGLRLKLVKLVDPDISEEQLLRGLDISAKLKEK